MRARTAIPPESVCTESGPMAVCGLLAWNVGSWPVLVMGVFAQHREKVHVGGRTGLASGSSIPYLPDLLGVRE
jgi:hypothetical protein